MDSTARTTTGAVVTADSRHAALAIAWARWNGRKGTAKQIAPIMRMLRVADLERMLSERGVDVYGIY